MAIEIVTGKKGTAHVSSNDDQGRNQSIIGTGSYVAEIGEQFGYSLVSNNELSLKDGEAYIQGVHFRILPGSTESVTIENGTQSTCRKDLVVARYTKNTSNGFEDVTLHVIKGREANTENAAVLPSYTAGDILNGAILAEMPLYEIDITGITVSKVRKLFTTISSLADLNELKNSVYTNVIPTGYVEGSAPGLTVDRRDDGTILVNGTATASGFIVVYRGRNLTDNKTIVQKNKKYILSNTDPVPNRVTLQFDMRKEPNDHIRGASVTQGKISASFDTFNMPDTWTHSIVYYDIPNGASFNNVVLKPMIIEDLTAEIDYVPYSGGSRLNENVAEIYNKVEEHTEDITQINADLTDSGWVKFDNTHNAYYRRIGDVVTVRCEGNVPYLTDLQLTPLPFSIPKFEFGLSLNKKTFVYCDDGKTIHFGNSDSSTASHEFILSHTTLIN